MIDLLKLVSAYWVTVWLMATILGDYFTDSLLERARLAAVLATQSVGVGALVALVWLWAGGKV